MGAEGGPGRAGRGRGMAGVLQSTGAQWLSVAPAELAGSALRYYFNYYNFLNRSKVVHNSRFCHLYTCQMQSIKHK